MVALWRYGIVRGEREFPRVKRFVVDRLTARLKPDTEENSKGNSSGAKARLRSAGNVGAEAPPLGANHFFLQTVKTVR